MTGDIVETLGRSVVQHGKANDRIYLMKLAADDYPTIIPRLDELAARRGYGKIFAKIPAPAAREFITAGYRQEALVPGFYNGADDGAFLGKYFHPERESDLEVDLVEDVIRAAAEKGGAGATAELPAGFSCRRATPDDVSAMAELYRQVFAFYPFPIHDPEYLRETMAANVSYYGVWEGETLAALSSAEMDVAGQNAEMTDFATHPDYRAQGLAGYLLQLMDSEAPRFGIRTAYTVARACSYGMNITFARSGYRFSGTLVNNTDIAGRLESMNVWYKRLDDPQD